MSRIRHLVSALAGLALVALSAQSAQAQPTLSNGPISVSLQGVKVERIQLDLSTTALTSNTDLAANNSLGNLNASMSWSLNPSRGVVHLVGWFSTTTALTDGAGNNVATADFLGACTATNMGGSACSATPAAFDQGADAAVGAAAGTSRLLWSSPAIVGTTRNQTGIYASLAFQVRSTTVASLPAGTYTGTLNLRAYTQ